MKYCVFCAEELPDDANFCSRCGKPQNAAPPEKTPEQVKAAAERKAAAKPAKKEPPKPEPKTKAKARQGTDKKPAPKPATGIFGIGGVTQSRINLLEKFNKKRAIVYDYTARGSCEKRHCGFNNCTFFASKAASDPENYLTACMKIKKAMTAGIIEKLNSLDADD